jgi:hypothetical protein
LLGLIAAVLLLGSAIVVYGPPYPPDPYEGPGGAATFSVIALQAPASAQVKQEIIVTTTIKNTGTGRGAQNIEFRVDGRTVRTVSQLHLYPQQEITLTFRHTFEEAGKYKIGVATLSDAKYAEITVTPAGQQPQQPSGTVLKFALLHSETSIYPGEIVIPLGAAVEIGHMSADGKPYPAVVLRVVDAPGQSPGALAFGTLPVAVEPNKITLQQFTADKPGEYEYTHILMGHSTKAKVIVSASAAGQQQSPALQRGLIHSETAIYPDEIVLPLGATVEIGHISLDEKTYPSVVLRVVNATGQTAGALAFGTLLVSVEPHKITLQQFTADKPGEYEYTHILMGGPGKAKVIVK